MIDFKIGDVVRKINDSTLMTVHSVHSVSEDVTCVWFVGSALNRQTFPKENLVFIK